MRNALRQEMRARRLALSPQEQVLLAQSAARKLTEHPFWEKAGEIALYSPIRQELDTQWVARLAWEQNKRLLYPRVEGQQMAFYPVNTPQDLRPGAWGILEPVGKAPREDLSRALMLVPALAVDAAGYRLGWGGGYYDRYFAQHPVGCRLGFVYGFQLVETTDPQPWDQPLDGVITP